MNRRIVLLLVLFCTGFSFAQAQVNRVTKYTLEDGLSHHQINWVFQDSRGVMWIGAINGINRFDGSEFKLVEKCDFYNVIEVKVFEDRDGDLWIISGKGHQKPILFNIHSEKIKSLEEKFGSEVSFDPSEIIDGLLLKDETLLIGLKTGSLIFYDLTQKKELRRIETELSRFRCVASVNDNNFWLIAKKGLPVQNSSDPKLTEIYYVEKDKPLKHLKSFPDFWTFGFGVSDDNKLIVGSGAFINYIYPNGEISKESIKGFSQNNLTHSHSQRSAIAFSRDQYWIISNSSVFTCFENKKNSFKKLIENKKLDVSTFYNLYASGDFLWVGSIDGLFKINLKASRFQQALYKSPSVFSQKEFNSCRGITSDNEGNIYVSSSSIYQLHQSKPIIQNSVAMDLGVARALLYDEKNKLWFGTGNTIGKLDLQTKASKTFKLDQLEHVNGAWSLFQDSNQRLWIAAKFGLQYLDEGSDQIKIFKKFNGFADFEKESILTYSFFKDQKNRIWLTTSGGLFQLDLEQGIVGRYWQKAEAEQFLPATDFRHMYQDKDGIFWIATKAGLIRWDEKKGQTQLFNDGDGFLNNQLYAVYEDDYGFLWISSDNGIIQFERSSHRVKTFLPPDGITHREFNRISHHQIADGTIYFGGLNGVTYFHPKDFYKSFNEHPEIKMALTACQFFSETTNGKEDQLSTFKELGQITMHPGDKYLEVEFALLDYANPKEIQYAYAINPEDIKGEKGWNVTKETSINIGFLPYGEHQLVIKGKTANGQYSSKKLTIPIHVFKPFYLKNWFMSCLFIGFCVMVYFYQKMKTKRLKKRQKELEYTVAERTEIIQLQKEELLELDNAKSRFLANISHELRTPLTLIMNSLSEENAVKIAKELEQPGLRHFYERDIHIIQRNANRLHRLIEQLLDLSKLESGRLSLAASKQDFFSYLRDLVDSFGPLARQKKIELDFDANTDQLELYFDREKMDKILYNLLSNAIKFTPPNGNILVDLEQRKQEVFVSINDTGIGIPKKDQAFIFNRFYQVKRKDSYAFEGTGLGLAMVKEMLLLHHGAIDVDSEPGQGTCFRISLPIDHQHLRPEEMIVPNQIISTQKRLKLENEIQQSNSLNDQELSTEEKPILLIIEDHEDLLYHQQKLFQKEYNLLIAQNGIQGINLAIEHIPDIIICDVMMPGKDGYEVCKDLKTQELTDHIPIILLTAKATHEEKLEGLVVGADSYLTKPYDQKELSLHLKNKLELIQNIQKKYKFTNEDQVNNSSFNPPQSPFVSKVIEIIDDNITNSNFGVEELALILRLSRSQLFRKLKALTGETPAIFIRRYRLEKARVLLQNFEGNPSEIAYQVGFSSPSYFYKCFKKEYGITPTELIN